MNNNFYFSVCKHKHTNFQFSVCKYVDSLKCKSNWFLFANFESYSPYKLLSASAIEISQSPAFNFLLAVTPLFSQIVTLIPTKCLPQKLKWGTGPPPAIQHPDIHTNEEEAINMERGHLLWIRGITRLETQVQCARRCSLFSLLSTRTCPLVVHRMRALVH